MKSFNLIPADRLRQTRRRLRVRAWARVLVAYALALVVLVGGSGLLTDQTARIEKLEAQIAQSTTQAMTANAELVAMTPQLQELHRAIQTTQAIAQQPNWGVLLNLLADAKGGQVVLERCSLQPIHASSRNAASTLASTVKGDKTLIGYQLAIDGYGRSQREVSEFALTLEQAQLFDRLDVKQTQRQQLMERTVTAFQMQGLLTAAVESP